MVDGIDTHVLTESGKYRLDDKQFNILLEKVFKKPKYEAEIINRYQILAINKFSIDINDKQYVVAYRGLTLNFKDKTLKMSQKSSINKSFLINEDKKITLGMYLDIDPDDFTTNYDKNENEYIELIKQNFRNGELINTRPTIFFLARNNQHGIDETFEAIQKCLKDNESGDTSETLLYITPGTAVVTGAFSALSLRGSRLILYVNQGNGQLMAINPNTEAMNEYLNEIKDE